MTELLEQAIAQLKTLPANDQDAIALARKSLMNPEERIIADYLRPILAPVKRFKRSDLSALDTPAPIKARMSLKQALQQQGEKATAEKEELFLELLEVFDALEFFLNYIEENPDPNPKFFKRLPKSLGTIQKKLLNILERRQVQPIEFQDTKPDYSVCQVVDREEREDIEEQTITKVVRQGFRVEDKVLRPIEVITSKKTQS